MSCERARNAVIVVEVTAGLQGAWFDLGRQVGLFQREQPAGMEDDVGVGDAAIGQ